jgi:hypothetical protein
MMARKSRRFSVPLIGNADAGMNGDWIKQVPGYRERVRADLEARRRAWREKELGRKAEDAGDESSPDTDA